MLDNLIDGTNYESIPLANGINIEVSNISYWINNSTKYEKQILDNISFSLEPGELCALMGPSGSGKSTLLDLIADRKMDGHWSGELYFNCKPRNSFFHRQSGYVLQDDLHIPLLTVYETLEFAAKFRLPEGSSHSTIKERVETLLQFLGLSHVANSIVGDHTIKGISGGQMKRLSIGVEMISLPDILFLDEPTSGLDSTVALEVMTVVQNITKKNRTCISTIHQPSPEIFSLFDKLVLICNGKLIYFGEASRAKDYFSSPPLNYPYFEGTNEAEFIIDCCEGMILPKLSKINHSLKKLNEFYIESSYYYSPLTLQDRETKYKNKVSLYRSEDFHSNYPTSSWSQFKTLLYRSFLDITRDKSDLVGQVTKNICVALIMGIVFFGQAQTETPIFSSLGIPNSTVNNINNIIYFGLIFTLLNNTQVIPLLCSKNLIYLREVKSKSYSPTPYWLVNILCHLPLATFCFTVFSCLCYTLLHFPYEMSYFGYFYLIMYLSSLTSFYFALFLASATNSDQISLTIFPLFFLFLAIFSGFTIGVDSIPPFYRYWAVNISYFRWVYQGLFVNQWSKYDDEESLRGETIIEMFEFDGFNKWNSVWILFLSIFVMVILVRLALEPRKSKLVHINATTEPEEASHDVRNILINTNNIINTLEENISVSRQNSQSQIYSSRTPQTIVFKDINYSVKFKNIKSGDRSILQILKGINGRIEPGEMCALMGASGAGKSTLLDILADRKSTGIISGSIFINGLPRTREMMNNTAYVMQDNVHHWMLTVRETLRFSALLRLPTSTSVSEIETRVQDVLNLLNISHVSESIVGDESHRGISGGQKKRLSIGVEIIHFPDMIFLDEPTTGLDSTVSYEVMNVVRSLATQRRTIISTIHQPSPSTFALFDSLLLLSYGKVIYFGPVKDCVSFFTNGPLSFPYKVGSNPADFVISVASGTRPTIQGNIVPFEDLVRNYETSSLGSEFLESISGNMRDDLLSNRDQSKKSLFKTTYLSQVGTLLQRALLIKCRTIKSVLFSSIRFFIIGILYGTVYLNLRDGYEYTAYINRLSLIFFAITLTIMAHQHDIPELIHDRSIFYRERGSFAYSTFSYWMYHSIETFLVSMVNIFLFAIPLYYLTGLWNEPSKFLYFYLMILLSDITCYFIIIIVTGLSPTIQFALSMFPIILFLSTCFIGFVVFLPDFPSWIEWGTYLTHLRYAFQGMVLNEFKDNDKLPLGDLLVDNMMGFDTINQTECACYIFIFTFIYGIISYLVLKYVSFEKK